MDFETFGGRKFVLGLGVMLLGVGVDAVSPNGLTPNLLDLLKFVSIGFFLGNSVNTIAGAVMTKKTGDGQAMDAVAITEAVATDMGTIEGKVDSLAEQVKASQEAVVLVQQAVLPILQYVRKLEKVQPLDNIDTQH